MKSVFVISLIALTITSTAKAEPRPEAKYELTPEAKTSLTAAGIAAAAGCGLAILGSIDEGRPYPSEMLAGCLTLGAVSGAAVGSFVAVGQAVASPAPTEEQLLNNDSEE